MASDHQPGVGLLHRFVRLWRSLFGSASGMGKGAAALGFAAVCAGLLLYAAGRGGETVVEPEAFTGADPPSVAAPVDESTASPSFPQAPDPSPVAPAEDDETVIKDPDGTTADADTPPEPEVSPAGTYELVEESALRALALGAETDIDLDSYARGSITIDDDGAVTGSLQLSYLASGGSGDASYVAETAQSALLTGVIGPDSENGHYTFAGTVVATVQWFDPNVERELSGSTDLDVTGRLDIQAGVFELALLGEVGSVEFRR